MIDEQTRPFDFDIPDGGTVISECGRYRYRLHRHVAGLVRVLDATRSEPGDRPCIFIMVNPSTADTSRDDPTIRKCRQFAFLWNCNSLWVINLFAYRNRDKDMLLKVEDPVGPENDKFISQLLKDNPDALIVCGWGNLDKRLRWRQDEFMAKHFHGRKAFCLGINMDGTPVHPLYRSYQTELMPYPE